MNPFQGKIGRPLVVYLLLFSGAITLLLTAVELYHNYGDELDRIEHGFELIGSTHLEQIENSVWTLNRRSLNLELQSLLRFPDIVYAEVRGGAGDYLARAGKHGDGDELRRSYTLQHLHRGQLLHTGKLLVVASLSGVYSRLWARALTILFSHLIKTLLVSAFLVLIVHQLIVRHLVDLSEHAAGVRLGQPYRPFKLRRKSGRMNDNDEIERLAGVINHTHRALWAAYEELGEREQMLYTVQENIPDMLLLLGPDGHVVECNQQTCDKLGFAMESLVDCDLRALFLPINESRWTYDPLQPVLDGKPLTMELRARTGNDSWLPVEVSLRRLQDTPGLALVVIARDISARQRFAQVLQDLAFGIEAHAEQAFFDELARHMSETLDLPFTFIGRLDTDAEVPTIHSVAVHASGEVGEPFSYTLPGTPCENVVGRSACGMPAHIAEEYPQDLMLQQMGFEGYLGAPLFDAAGRSLGIAVGLSYEPVEEFELKLELVKLYAMRAAYEMQRLGHENALREMQVQTEKMTSLGGLAAGMAHEINNPLASILHNLELLRQRLDADLHKNRQVAEEIGLPMAQLQAYVEQRGLRPAIQAAVDSSRRAAGIVRNMLDFARQSDSRYLPADLSQLLDETLELAGNDIALKKEHHFPDIRVERCYQTGLPEVPCDRGRLQQVFFNLLKNAAQAMSNAGTESPRIRLTTRRSEDWAVVEIEDSGPGVGQAEAKHLFDPFYTTKPEGQGTGLGLSIAYFIVVENHHGRIRVEPGELGGARFVIELPITKVPAALGTDSAA